VREARAVATWRHDSIIQIYYADDSDGLYYFVMEYIAGKDLSQILAAHSANHTMLPHSAVLQIGKSIASALDYAHSKGVIHRDVKPSNVMVAEDQRVVLMDFGLALDMQAGSAGEVFGTAHYIAPEQARRSADAVPQSDLYALGVLLYEMLTGAVPFDDPSATSVALQHLTQPPPLPRQLNPRLNPQIEVVLLKALSKAPTERYQTGAELIAALEAAMQLGSSPAQAPASDSQPASGRPASDSQPGPPSTLPPLNPEENLVGQYLDAYRIEALLGRGGMANIYRGMDVRLKRNVAIKVIDAPFRTESEYASRFKREAQAIAQLEHPNIVRLYQYGDANGLLYMVMEYIEGVDLHQVLSDINLNPAIWTPRALARLVREVCAALDYAHGKGVIHRDIKPSNIMIDKSSRAVLADFGLALLTEVGTRGEIFGSPHYVAPEQAISSAKVVPQSDLYGIGVILYQMWTGRIPFDDADPLAIAMLHMTEPPRPPREIRPEISPQLEAVILKTLAKDPADRYPTGAALADALDAALGISSGTASQGLGPQESGGTHPAISQPQTPIAQAATVISQPYRPMPPVAPANPAPSNPVSAPPQRPIAPPQKPPSDPRAPTSRPAMALPPPPAAVAGGMSAAAASSQPRPASAPGQPQAAPAATQSQPLPTAAPPPAQAQAATLPTPPRGIGAGSRVPVRALLLGLVVVLGLALAAFLLLRKNVVVTPAGQATSTVAAAGGVTADQPTSTVAAAGGVTDSGGGAAVQLTIVRAEAGKNNGVLIINSASSPLALSPLSFGKAKSSTGGDVWGLESLAPGGCLMASTGEKGKDKKDEEQLSLASFASECTALAAEPLVVDKEAFWAESFDVSYNSQALGSCAKDQSRCTIAGTP
jgi:serine/threonine protein kinase